MQHFIDSEVCRSRAFCTLCRAQTEAGAAWRKMVAERYFILGNRLESGELAIDAADFCCVLEEGERRSWMDPPPALDTPRKRAIRRACSCGK